MKISVYTTPSCYYCKKVKEFLKVNNIPFESVDVQDDIDKRTEMIELSGQFGVPVVRIDDAFFVGYNQQKLNDLKEKYHE